MDWLQMPTKNRKDLIIFMERIKRPIRPTAGLIVPLSSSTFVSVGESLPTFSALYK